MLVNTPPAARRSLLAFGRQSASRSAKTVWVAIGTLGALDYGLGLLGVPSLSARHPINLLQLGGLFIFVTLIVALCEALGRLHTHTRGHEGIPPTTVLFGFNLPTKDTITYAAFALGLIVIYAFSFLRHANDASAQSATAFKWTKNAEPSLSYEDRTPCINVFF